LCYSASLEDSNDPYYIQGAGDDEESWSKGLSPLQFWNHRNEILQSPSTIEEVVDSIKATNSHQPKGTIDQLIITIATTNMYVSWETLSGSTVKEYDAVLDCSTVSKLSPPAHPEHYCHCPISSHKKNRISVDKEFPPALRFLLKQLRCGHRVLIYSYSDMSSVFAVCLSALSLAFDEKGRLRQSQNINISKADIQKRFLFLASIYPQLRIQRFLRRAINRMLLSSSNLLSHVDDPSTPLKSIELEFEG